MRKLIVEINAQYMLDDEDNAQWAGLTPEEQSARLREIEDGGVAMVTANMDEGAIVTATARVEEG